MRFIEVIIARVMPHSAKDKSLLELREAIAKRTSSMIRRVLLAYASPFTMHPSLSAMFPGSKNRKPVSKAHLKLQRVVDLLTGRWTQFSIDRYERNHLKAAIDLCHRRTMFNSSIHNRTEPTPTRNSLSEILESVPHLAP